MTKKTIEIFRAGKHVAMNGDVHVFSQADVQAIADIYDPAVFLSPIVIGHPTSNGPAYAWAEDIRVRDDGVLVADLEAGKIDAAFAEAVDKGAYRKVSLALYGPDQKGNPSPGSFYPRHIGFLGAAAPGVKGLSPVNFAEGDEFIEFATDAELRPMVWLARIVARLMRSQRDRVIATAGLEAANKEFPDYEVDELNTIAGRLDEALQDTRPAFSELDPALVEGAVEGDGLSQLQPEEIAAVEAARASLEAGEAQFAEREAALAEREQAQAERDAAFSEGQRTARAAEDDAFLDGLVTAGRLPPGRKGDFALFCELLGEVPALAFSEGADPESPRDRLKTLLSTSLGTAIHFEEIAEGDGARFAEGQTADQLANAARGRVAEATARGESLSVSAAMTAITAGR